MKQDRQFIKCEAKWYFKIISLAFISITMVSCNFRSPSNSQTKSNQNDVSVERQAIKVDVETASLGSLSAQKQHKGTTQPLTQISWRSQVEGILIELLVKSGDRVQQGQLIGRLDDRILLTDIAGKAGDLAALESELAQAEIQVANAQIGLQEAEIQLEQANNEAIRYQNLAKTGLIAQQQAESFKTEARIAEKTLLTAQEAVKSQEQAVAIVQGRIATQNSLVAESKQRQTYSQIIAPIDGIVIAKAKDPGNLIRGGEEVVTIGDFSQIKIVVPLSELDLGQVTIGQNVRVKLDAFKGREFEGKVSRIAPTTNPSSRQIAVEIVMENFDGEIKGGLLARVSFTSENKKHVIVPESTIVRENDTNYIFAVAKETQNRQSNVAKRRVIVGDRLNNKIEIIAGISPGEKYVVRSSKPLKDRDLVSLSIISQ